MQTYGDEEKAFFQAYGCSKGGMLWEEPNRFARYQACRIPVSTERKWASESLKELVQRVEAMTDALDIAHAHGRFDVIASNFESPDALTRIARFTHAIAEKLATPLSKILVAENLIGRNSGQSDGVIYRARQAALPEVAQQLMDVALVLVWKAEAQGQKLERCDEARRSARRLAKWQKLSCFAPPETGIESIVYLVDPARERKLVDPTIEEVFAGMRSLEWKNVSDRLEGSSVTLRRLPADRSNIDRIIVEKQFVPDGAPASPRFDVSWCWFHAIRGGCWIRTRGVSLEVAGDILAAALEGDVDRLRTLADWSFPPALEDG